MTERRLEGPLPVFAVFMGMAALVAVFFFRDFIFGAGRMIGGPDLLRGSYPLRELVVGDLQAGRGLPLWIPFVNAGAPLAAADVGPVFYPTTVLYFLMPIYRAIGWAIVLHTVLGAGFGFFLGRSFGLSPWSAAVCGATLLLTGPVVSTLPSGQDSLLFAMTMIPLGLGALERALGTGDPRWYAGVAVAIGLQILAPHAEVALLTALLLGSYLIFRVLFTGVSRSEAGGFVAALAVGAGLGAVQLIPGLALLDGAVRSIGGEASGMAVSGTLPPQEITALVLPDLIGTLGLYWGEATNKLHSEYVGAVPAALSALALAGAVVPLLGRRPRRTVWFLWGMVSLGLFFLVGPTAPIHPALHAALPVGSSLGTPTALMSLVAVCVALLAGLGWEAVLAARRKDTRPGIGFWIVLVVLGLPIVGLASSAVVNPYGFMRWVRVAWFEPGWPILPREELAPVLRTGGLVLLAGLAVAWGVGVSVWRRWLPTLSVVVVIAFAVADSWRIAARFRVLGEADARPALADDELLDALRAEASPGERVWAHEIYGPNRFASERIPSVSGRQPFQLEPYARLLGGAGADGLLDHPNLMPFFRVRYLLVAGSQPRAELLARGSRGFLYAIPAPPHAFFPSEVASADPEDAVVGTRANLDPLSAAVVEVEPGRGPPPAGRGSARLTTYEAEVLEFEVEVEQAGLLVVSEILAPGWRALVDEIETPIWRTNVAFRGVVVPEGAHSVRFVYANSMYRVGGWLSAVVALGLALAVWRLGRSRRSPTSGNGERSIG